MTSQPSQNQTVKYITLVVTAMGAFLTPFMSSSINIALPSIGKEFTMDAVLLGWVATSYLLAAAIFVLPCGRLGDLYGRKKLFLYGTVLYAASSFLSAVAPSAVLLIGFRILQGIGAAMIFGTVIAILTSVFPLGERGKAIGINVASTYSGLSLGPVLGGFLTQHFGWRSIFLLNVVGGLIIIGGVLWKLTGEWAEAKGERFDWVGALLSSLMLVAVILGFSRLPALPGVGLILAGIVALVVFVWWERRVRYPLLPIELFSQNRVFAFSNLAALINYSATFAIGFLLSLYLQYIKGLTPQNAGLILVAQPIMMAIFSPFAGRLSDRIESRILASTGMGLIVVGLIGFSLLSDHTPIAYITAILLLVGIGFALFSSPNMNAIMSSVEKRFYGIASATLATMRSTGQALSIGLVMLIFTLYIGKVQITPAYYAPFLTSVKIAFATFALLCGLGVVVSLVRGNVR
ncbi:MFS transporter [candidate division KSB3 bacterium]|uniref:MFS transporter n=1 Tax=candidate division KSB3 bacterium TaxID=2044937 RepID=A0A9D5JS13_9BACT|nr:MFS transporter [candidate division KSB3 bacterium]MBD3323123.1 MFS transporter [candidate division KSB3 bacterium]